MNEIELVERWETSDGELFEVQADAQEHEAEKITNKIIDEYINSHEWADREHLAWFRCVLYNCRHDLKELFAKLP